MAAEFKLTPPLKWAGGKRWLVPRLKTLWGPLSRRRLVEPFCGGLAICLGLRPEKALLNDINQHLINFYHWLQKGLVVSLKFKNKEDAYYRCRDLFNDLISTAQGAAGSEAAQLFYYLNRTGYNGLCRFNKKGQFNVPFGRYKRINYARDFLEYQAAVADWEFVSGDFAGLKIGPSDFIYADPPYDVEFTQYAQDDFLWEDQIRLARWLAAHPGPVIASNQATDRIIKLYKGLGFSIDFLKGPRRISCTGDRGPALEILAVKGI
ncbi:MAG: Dam family site-specific DNA-(adenine-N6)-methyltransferase [Firmicutes bacterium]|nr:Dam family site-specific DNA-(adenine-N6)-methyltransferase [Bacillota bacterium]